MPKKPEKKKKVVVRMPPSPTGPMHVGTARVALFNYLFARQNKGTYFLRIEDTDRERSKKEYETDLIDNLKWLGLEHDGEIWRQSERTDIYKKYLRKMVEEGKAYISKEEPKEAGQRAEVVRFKNPNKVVEFDDLIRGHISFDTTELGDFVIAKSLDEPLYHLTVVVDDHEMEVTHVIRGEDHISNTPLQILIQDAIGAERPIYAHLPLILAPDRSKLSKRKHGQSVSVSFYREQGYLSDALINFLALIGWNPGTEQEIFSIDELIKQFDLSKVQKSGAIFNTEKLNWLNKEYLKQMPTHKLQQEMTARLKPFTIDEKVLERALPTILERIDKLADIDAMKDSGEISYLYEEPEYKTEELLWKGQGDFSTMRKHLEKIERLLAAIPEPFEAAEVKDAVWPYAEAEGRGAVLWPLRMALSGKQKSPDPFTLAGILGKETTIRRLRYALEKNP